MDTYFNLSEYRYILPEVLLLSEEEIQLVRQKEQDEKRKREAKARSVLFNGELIDPLACDDWKLSETLATALSKGAVVTRLGDVLDLSTRGRGAGAPGGRRGGGKRAGRLRAEQKEFVGFLGECAVFHWLKRQFPEKTIEDAWRSEYRKRLLGSDGDDNLGYDFEIRFRGKQWFLEVKSHLGDPLEIELGESQVRKASECARRGSGEYRILYVSNLQDPELLNIETLPNPLGDVNREQFQVMGTGLRYRFQRRQT